MTIRPTLASFAWGLVLLGIAAMPWIAIVGSGAGLGAGWAGLLVACIWSALWLGIAIAMAQTSLRWCTIDPKHGTLRWRKGLLGALELDLKSVVAVQSLAAETRHGYRVFEINLVLANGRRVNLARELHGKRTAQDGRRLAACLNVPWIDHCRHG